MAESAVGRDRVLAPRRVFLAVAVLLLLALLFGPTSRSVNTARSSTTFSADANGARGLYEVLDKLGFRVQRWLQPMRRELNADAVYVIASPPYPLTPTEVHRLLTAVRGGAGLLVRPIDDTPLADSLGMTSRVVALSRDTFFARRDTIGRFAPPTTEVLRTRRVGSNRTFPLVLPAGARVFQAAPTGRGVEPTILGYSLGRGRVIAYANNDLVRNATVRLGGPAVQAVRLFEWLNEGKAQPIWFDEYHHGFGTHADLMRATRRGLFGTAPGRVLLQLAAAGLVLLLAIGVRPVKPRPVTRIERRSALEHVDALARAYSAVRANGLATRLLVRGLRRRHAAVHSKADEAAYLRTLREQKPELSSDIDQLSDWLRSDAVPSETGAVSATVSRIERGLRL